MSTILKRVEIGNVGDSPGIVLLSTNLTNSDIRVAGFINSVQPYSGTQVLSTDMVLACCSDGNQYYTVSIASGIITLTPITSSGSGSVTQVNTSNGITGGPITTSGTVSFANIGTPLILANISNASARPIPNTLSDILDTIDNTQGSILYRSDDDSGGWLALEPGDAGDFLQTAGLDADPKWASAAGFAAPVTVYFATGGNDSNPGTNALPVETLDQAIILANQLIEFGGAMLVQIIGLGVGVDTSNVNITQSGIWINAPGYQLNPPSGDAITVNIPGISGGSYVNINLAASVVTSGAKVLNLIATSTGNNNVTRFAFSGPVYGDVYMAVKCEFYATIIAGVVTALEQFTKLNVLYGISSLDQASRLNLMGLVFGSTGSVMQGVGAFTNNWRYPMRQIKEITTDYTLITGDSGLVIDNATSSTVNILLPDNATQGTPPFNVGYEVDVLNSDEGTITFSVEGSDTLIGVTSLTVPGQRATVIKRASGVWVVSSGVSSSGDDTSSFAVIATDQVWEAAGATFPATNVAAVSPWTSIGNIDTGNFDPFYFVGPYTPADTFALARDYGSQAAGTYKIAFSTLQGPSRPIITVTEVNTSLAIGTFDTYYPGDTAIVGNVEMYFVWAGGDMNLNFACPTNNADATGFDFTMVGIVELSLVQNSVTNTDTAYTVVIPWTNFQYVTWYDGNSAWFPAANQNDPPFPQPTLPFDFGSTNVYAPLAGTYQFTVVTVTNSDSAILTFSINGIDTTIDAYSPTPGAISYVWTQSLLAGNNEIAFSALTKNLSSTDYQVRLSLLGMAVVFVSGSP